MKFRYRIKITLEVRKEILVEKINSYLIKNFYRITERGEGYIIFVEDEFSNRRRSKSDVHTRLEEGKFIFDNLTDSEIVVELIYFTSISYYVSLVMLLCAFGIYTNNIFTSIIMSFVLSLPFIYRIIYLNGHVFKEIMED